MKANAAAQSTLTIALALVLSVFAFAPSVSHASTGLTIEPVKISHTLKPGESIKGVIRLSNASDEPEVQVDMKVEDFIPTAGAEGIQFVGRAPGVTTVRDWVTLEGSASFIFKRGESRAIPYTITAPATAEPGGHFGVAFFKASKIDSDEQLRVGTQVGVLIFITIPGDSLQKGQILDLTAPEFLTSGPVPFTMRFENTGTVHFEPKGTITITDMLGRTVGVVPVEGSVVLPTNIKELRYQWDAKRFMLGRYTASAAVVDGSGAVLTSKEVRFWIFPVWYILSFLGSVIVIFAILKFLRSRIKVSVSLK
jgi:hypothetical protein